MAEASRMDGVELVINSCLDCPRFRTHERRHWMTGFQVLYEYECQQAARTITPQDGVEPPPGWCPKRIR